MWYKSTAFTKHLFLIRMSPSLLSPSFSCLCLVTPFTLTSLGSPERSSALFITAHQIITQTSALMKSDVQCSASITCLDAAPWKMSKARANVKLSGVRHHTSVWSCTWKRHTSVSKCRSRTGGNCSLQLTLKSTFCVCVCVLVWCGYYSVWLRLPALVWTPESVQQSDSGHRCN